MNISNLGRLIGAGLLALGLNAIAPQDASSAAPATGLATPNADAKTPRG